MSIPVFQTVRQGYDVRTASEKDFTINSKRNQLKILTSQAGEVVLPAGVSANGSRAYVPITHNLGYHPFVMAWAKGSNDDAWYTVPNVLTGNGVNILSATSQGDYEAMITFYIPNFTYLSGYYAQTIQYSYVIYIDPSKDAWYA